MRGPCDASKKCSTWWKYDRSIDRLINWHNNTGQAFFSEASSLLYVTGRLRTSTTKTYYATQYTECGECKHPRMENSELSQTSDRAIRADTLASQVPQAREIQERF